MSEKIKKINNSINFIEVGIPIVFLIGSLSTHVAPLNIAGVAASLFLLKRAFTTTIRVANEKLNPLQESNPLFCNIRKSILSKWVMGQIKNKNIKNKKIFLSLMSLYLISKSYDIKDLLNPSVLKIIDVDEIHNHNYNIMKSSILILNNELENNSIKNEIKPIYDLLFEESDMLSANLFNKDILECLMKIENKFTIKDIEFMSKKEYPLVESSNIKLVDLWKKLIIENTQNINEIEQFFKSCYDKNKAGEFNNIIDFINKFKLKNSLTDKINMSENLESKNKLNKI